MHCESVTMIRSLNFLVSSALFPASRILQAGDLRGKIGLLYVQLSNLRHKFGVLDDSNGVGTGKCIVTLSLD